MADVLKDLQSIQLFGQNIQVERIPEIYAHNSNTSCKLKIGLLQKKQFYE